MVESEFPTRTTIAMLAAMVGWLAPVPAAIVQEVIDVAVILNALRALRPASQHARRTMPAATGRDLHGSHVVLIHNLDRLRSIADALDDATPERAAPLIVEANAIVQQHVVEHERDDEGSVYPKLARVLADSHGISAMSRAHREILHLARLRNRISGLPVTDGGGRLVGIVTEGDFLRRIETGTQRLRPRWIEFLIGPGRLADEYTHSRSRKVADVMSRDLITASEDTPVSEIVDLMEKHQIKRVPIVRDQHIIGDR